MKYALMLVALIGGIGVMMALHALPPRMRRMLIVAVTFLTGLYYVLEFFIPEKAQFFGTTISNPLTPVKPTIGNVALIVGSFTIFLGLVNLTMAHGKRIQRRQDGWGNSLALLAAMYGMIVVGLWSDYYPNFPSEPKWKSPITGEDMTIIQWIYDAFFRGMLNPLEATMFALLAFYITSAAYRAFRVRTLEAGLMLSAAFLVMIGAVPMGQYMTHWVPSSASFLRVENIKSWILSVPNSAAQQGIAFGVYTGALAMGLRIWLSLERGSYFEQQS